MFNGVPVNSPLIPSFPSSSRVISSKLDLSPPILSKPDTPPRPFFHRPCSVVEFVLNHPNIRTRQTQESFSARLA